jgi:hypothetical protein
MCGAAGKDDEIFLTAIWLRQMPDRGPLRNRIENGSKEGLNDYPACKGFSYPVVQFCIDAIPHAILQMSCVGAMVCMLGRTECSFPESFLRRLPTWCSEIALCGDIESSSDSNLLN